MSARRFALLAALAFIIIFVAANLLANSWLRSWRLDLTENQLYSLSPGTQRTLNELTEPVQLTLYYSRDAAAGLPQLQAYAARVREMLLSFEARSRGRVRFTEVNVQPFTEQEDQAVEAGVQPIRPYQGADPIYFGLVGANAIDDQRGIPNFDPQREPFLEYEVTRLIYELENPNRTRVALITALPLQIGEGAGAGQSVFAREMGRLLEVETLAPDFTTIPDADVLAIIHPGALSDAQLYAIDQFIMTHGRAFIALDPASLLSEQSGGFDPFNPVAPPPTSSNLAPLLASWGVTMTNEVILDGEGALPVRVQTPDGQVVDAPQPLVFTVPAAELDREDLMTAWLQRGINFALAGAFAVSQREGIETQPLARTSGRTMRLPAAQALMRPSPFELMQMWPQTGGRVETIALRVSGVLPSTYADGVPDGVTVESAPIPNSTGQAQVVLVADADFLADDFYIDPSNGGTAADNAAFALNALDVLGGSDALVSLRSRAPSLRPMSLVEDMERDAQRRIERRQEELEAELAETESRLAELQARGAGSGFFSGNLGAELTPEESAEIERFRARALEVRGELRRVERDLRSDIDRLEALVLFVNVWLAPLLVAGAGLFLFWRRQRGARRGLRR